MDSHCPAGEFNVFTGVGRNSLIYWVYGWFWENISTTHLDVHLYLAVMMVHSLIPSWSFKLSITLHN